MPPSPHTLLPPTQIRAKLTSAHQEVVSILASTRVFFEADSEEVLREWVRFTQAVDKRLEEALRAAVRRSLLDLSRLINGDKKQPVQPIFR
jgi:dynein heavy chain